MSDFAHKFLTAEALLPAERSQFVQDPQPTLQTLLTKAQRGSPAESSQAVQALLQLTDDTWEDGVRQAAMDALVDALSGNGDMDALLALEQLGQQAWPVLMRRVLARSISAPLSIVIPVLYKVKPDETVAQVSELAADRTAVIEARKWAIDILRLLADSSSTKARETLRQLATQDQNVEVQAFAVRMLTAVKAAAFLDDLGGLITRTQDPLLLGELLDYMQMTRSPDALSYLRRLTSSRDDVIRSRLTATLRAIGSPDAISIIAELLRYERETLIIREAVEALRQFGTNEAVDPLADVAINGNLDPGVRRLAITSLREIGTERAAKALVTMLDRLRDAALETRALETLVAMSQEQSVAREALVQAIINPNVYLQEQAREYLKRDLTPALSQELADDVVTLLIESRRYRLDDNAARSIATLLRDLTQGERREALATRLRDLALTAENMSAIYVLRELVGGDRLAELVAPILDPATPERPSADQIKRAETILMAVPSERGIEILVQYRIDRSRRDRRERLGLVSTGEAGTDGSSEDIFRRLRKAGVAIFEDTAASRAKGAYWIMLVMNVATFVLTFAFTILCLYYAFLRNPEATTEALQLLAGGGALLGGVLTVIQARLFTPVKAVQDAVANLAMVQITFMGFISRLEQVRVVFQDLYLNSTFDVNSLKETDTILEDMVGDSLQQMAQFLRQELPARE